MDGGGKIGEATVHVASAGNQPRLVGADVRQGPESVHLQLKEVIRVVERIANAYQLCWG